MPPMLQTDGQYNTAPPCNGGLTTVLVGLTPTFTIVLFSREDHIYYIFPCCSIFKGTLTQRETLAPGLLAAGSTLQASKVTVKVTACRKRNVQGANDEKGSGFA
ncbi:hypothetical protein EYF80_030250 [Liparis tanakae]|uniref:Uncharacterized protein n=1 Tax=Liparis tanakae TaxID=230148 RepID=A0A4Z2H188_9TELE|nr:hypothetical protein EYF80_030250 [Liparis tanakae]